MTIPGFESAQRAYENMLPPDDDADWCDDGSCEECLAEDARWEAEDLAEQAREDARLGL